MLFKLYFYFKLRDSIRDCFVTGDWDPEDDAEEVIKSKIFVNLIY